MCACVVRGQKGKLLSMPISSARVYVYSSSYPLTFWCVAHADTDGDIRILEAASDSDKAKAIVKIHRSPVLLLRLHPQLNAVSFPPLSLQSQLSVTSCCKRPASITANYTSVVEGSGCILSCAVFVWIPLVV